MSGRSRMTLESFRPLIKGGLRGFATVKLPIGLVIADCPVMIVGRSGRPWVALPSKPRLDEDGRQLIVDGKAAYVSQLKWSDREVGDRFSAAVIALIEAKHGPLDRGQS